jgi:hypothetical protein
MAVEPEAKTGMEITQTIIIDIMVEQHTERRDAEVYNGGFGITPIEFVIFHFICIRYK